MIGATSRATFLGRRRLEDTAVGCRAFEQDDLARAAAIANVQMRSSHKRSANAWAERAKLLERLEVNFNARAEAYVKDRPNRNPVESKGNC